MLELEPTWCLGMVDWWFVQYTWNVKMVEVDGARYGDIQESRDGCCCRGYEKFLSVHRGDT